MITEGIQPLDLTEVTTGQMLIELEALRFDKIKTEGIR